MKKKFNLNSTFLKIPHFLIIFTIQCGTLRIIQKLYTPNLSSFKIRHFMILECPINMINHKIIFMFTIRSEILKKFQEMLKPTWKFFQNFAF